MLIWKQWFSTFRTFWPFYKTPHVVMTPNHNSILLLPHNFSIVMSLKVNIWYVEYLICDPPKWLWSTVWESLVWIPSNQVKQCHPKISVLYEKSVHEMWSLRVGGQRSLEGCFWLVLIGVCVHTCAWNFVCILYVYVGQLQLPSFHYFKWVFVSKLIFMLHIILLRTSDCAETNSRQFCAWQ